MWGLGLSPGEGDESPLPLRRPLAASVVPLDAAVSILVPLHLVEPLDLRLGCPSLCPCTDSLGYPMAVLCLALIGTLFPSPRQKQPWEPAARAKSKSQPPLDTMPGADQASPVLAIYVETTHKFNVVCSLALGLTKQEEGCNPFFSIRSKTIPRLPSLLFLSTQLAAQH